MKDTQLLYNVEHGPNEIKVINSSAIRSSSIEFLLKKYYLDDEMGQMYKEAFIGALERHNREGSRHFDGYEETVEDELVGSDIPCLIIIREQGNHFKRINTKGISSKFASLKTHRDIELFAKEYGLLGVHGSNNYYGINYGYTLYEPITVWEAHIKKVRNLLKLYQALVDKRKKQNIDILGNLVDYKEIGGGSTTVGLFSWSDGSPIETSLRIDNFTLEEIEQLDTIAGVRILISSIQLGLQGAINLNVSDIIRTSDTLLGFRIIETYSTEYLLAAIYYDLWKLITDETVIHICEYSQCGIPFKKSGRGKYCCNSHKTLASMERKQKK